MAISSVVSANIRQCLLQLAAGRQEGATFCPSEAARKLGLEWRPLMQPVREVAAVLVDEGLLVCTQKGVPADPLAARGPIRLARPSKD